MTAWKGRQVTSIKQNRTNKTVSLFGPDGVCVDEIDDIVYLANAQLRNLPHGRHRQTNPANSGSPTNNSITGIDPAADAYGTSPFLAGLRPGGVTRVRTNLPVTTWRGIPVYIEDEKPKPPLQRAFAAPGEIIGYRCWRIENGLLRSVYQPDFWHPGKPLEGRELGDWDSRGIHAWKDAGGRHYLEYIRSYLNQDNMYIKLMFDSNINGRPAMITGTVFLWGDVVEHERGWRAEYARVRSLDWLYPDADMMGHEQECLDHLRGLYGV
jgi:hypothetical protein